MTDNFKDKTIALAGVCQAAYFANELASTGKVRDIEGFNSTLNSLYIIDCEDTSEVFEEKLSNLSTGFKSLTYAFNRDPDYLGILKYTLTLMTLERKLYKRPDYLQKIQKDILDSRVFDSESNELSASAITKLANCYSSTVSLLQPRIILNGKPEHLKQTQITEKIRSVLLAGIRSAVLWSQMGGSQWQLLFKRKFIIDTAKQIRKEL